MARRGWLAPAAAAAAGLAVAVWMRRGMVPFIGHDIGLPLDDAWIHIRFAGNLAGGGGFAFNPGEPSAGSTSPLWVLILAAAGFLPGPAPERSLWASSLCFAAACGLAAWLARRLARRLQPGLPAPLPGLAGLAAGLGAAATGRFAWSAASGMEVPLAAALGLAILGLALPDAPGREASRRGPWLGLLCGLAVLARPETALLAVLALPAWALSRPRTTGRGAGRGLLPAAGVAAILILPWAGWCLALTGRPLPATFGPNAGGLGLPDLGYLHRAVWQLAGDQPLATLLAVAGVAALAVSWRRAGTPALLLPAAWVIGLPLAASVVAPNLRHHGRYTMPLIPVMTVLAAVGGAALIGLLARRLASSAVAGAARAAMAGGVALALLLPAAGLPALSEWRFRYGLEVENIHDQHERVGRWLAREAGPGCRVATHDIGAIGVLSGCRVTDLIGLVSPRVARLYVEEPDPARRDPEIRRLLVEQGVTHVAIYPAWFPSLARDPALTPVFEARLRRAASAGAALMRVYRTPAPAPW